MRPNSLSRNITYLKKNQVEYKKLLKRTKAKRYFYLVLSIITTLFPILISCSLSFADTFDFDQRIVSALSAITASMLTINIEFNFSKLSSKFKIIFETIDKHLKVLETTIERLEEEQAYRTDNSTITINLPESSPEELQQLCHQVFENLGQMKLAGYVKGSLEKINSIRFNH